MASRLTQISVERPKSVIAVIIILTFFFLIQFPKIVTDTDPKNMLPASSPVRVYNDQMESLFALHKDMMAVGIVNEKGIFNPATLERIARLTGEITKIKGVVVQDVMSLTTVDNVLSEDGQLIVRPVMDHVPGSQEEIETLQREVYYFHMPAARVVSALTPHAAIYIP